jgi:hypothetical protein
MSVREVSALYSCYWGLGYSRLVITKLSSECLRNGTKATQIHVTRPPSLALDLSPSLIPSIFYRHRLQPLWLTSTITPGPLRFLTFLSNSFFSFFCTHFINFWHSIIVSEDQSLNMAFQAPALPVSVSSTQQSLAPGVLYGSD